MELHEQYVRRDFTALGLIDCLCSQVTLRKTGQIMVMKETKTFDKEAQKIFVKEVRFSIDSNAIVKFSSVLGTSSQTSQASECSQFYRFTS